MWHLVFWGTLLVAMIFSAFFVLRKIFREEL